MKCPSVAALWPPSSLLSHRITAAAAFNHTLSLYTGASDGSIVYWSLSPLDPHRPISPTALLCGHAAEISALSTCSPEISNPSSILSACTAGVLCVWTRGTNRCRRRRRIPTSAGSPSLASPLPAYPRHVAIACEFSVLVVDSLTLNVVRTLIHDNASIMPVKHMAVFEDEGMERTGHAVLLFDGHGRARILKLSSESDLDEETAKGLDTDSFTEVESVEISGDGKIAAFVFPTRCLFKSVPNGAPLGELSLTNDSVSQVHPIGGMFIEDDRRSGFKSFIVWSSNGAAMVYMVLASDAEFRLEPVCEIPEISYSVDRELSVRFCELNGYLVRIESISSFEPNVTFWSVPQFELGSGNLVPSKMIGQGNFGGVTFGTQLSNRENNLGERREKETGQEFVGGSSNSIVRVFEHEKDGLGSDKRVVSSSIVLEDFYALYAVVYGFSNGEIEIVRFFNPFLEPDYQTNTHVSERQLSGHAGAAVLCLATHCMFAKSGEQNLRRALISGSKDSTVRVWDLDSRDLLVVMHHHIAPVRSIVLPPPGTNPPWSDCFLSVGDDGCVALVSLETLRVERIFPGHPSYPSMVAWDSARGYVACLCKNISSSSSSDSVDVLYLWDVKAGARERIIRGTASHSMFEHFCEGIDRNSITSGGVLGETTSASSLLPPVANDSSMRSVENGMSMFPETSKSRRRSTDHIELNTSPLKSGGKGNGDVHSHQYEKHPVKCYCPYPGIASLKFDLLSLMSLHYKQSSDEQVKTHASSLETRQRVDSHPLMESLEACLLRFSLCVLHLWDIDHDLDRLLTEEMNVCKPERCRVASGLMGDRGSLTLMFPGFHATLELWKSSSEFCAMRSLTIVSIAQRMVSLSHSCTTASSALAAFYTRNFAEKVPDIRPPLLQLLVSFWQDPSEHVRMAARSLFYCAAPRAIPHPLCDTSRTSTTSYKDSARPIEGIKSYEPEESSIIAWLESFETEEWIFYIEGTNQDAKASNIIVAAALVVWYPSIVNDSLAHLIVNQLIKLVMSTNDQYSSTAAELLGEGMEGTWKSCIGFEIPKIIGDIFFQIECLTGVPLNDSTIKNTALSANVREALVGTLLPSLAMADIPGFLNAIEGQIWATSSDSPVHLVSLKTLLRVVRGSPKPLAPYLDKVVNFVLQTMDPGNLVMRKTCLKSSMVALREIARVFPMISLNEALTRLAVGDAIVDSHNVTIRVYDTESVTKVKVLDASGPLGLPSFLETTSNTRIATAITALSFSPDGEGLVAFSENGLMIRWWSLGSAWWEKLSRSLVPVHCTKLIFVPPWEGFSPNSSRSSIMASITGHGQRVGSQDKAKELDDVDVLKLLLHNLDLSYRLQWTAARSVSLTRHGQELGIFQL